MTGTRDGIAPGGAQPQRLVFLLPALIFVALTVVFLVRLYSGDPSKVPSALIGKPAPEFSLPPLEGLVENGKAVPGLSRADLRQGEVTLVNVWASWCTPCLAEHPLLMRLRQSGAVKITGINYKDTAQAARSFLARHGNPFEAVGVDVEGKAVIDWGVYKVPESFLVDGAGKIIHKHIGALEEQSLAETILPIIEKARKSSY